MPFPTTPKMIARTEERLGYRLPKSWAARLLKSNGGEVVAPDGTVWIIRPVPDDTIRMRIKRGRNHLLREVSFPKSAFPRNGLTIAQDNYGNRLLLRPGKKGTYKPAVYCLNRITRKLHRVADSVDELESLTPKS